MTRPPTEGSLRDALTRSILAISLAMIVAAALISAVTAFLEAREHQDETLAAIAALVRAGRLGDERTLGDAGGFHEDADDESLVIRTLGANPEPFDPAGPMPGAGFHTRAIAGATWRVLVSERDGHRFLVARRTDVRDESAASGAMHTFVPTALLLAVMLLVVRVVVRRRFARLDALAARLDSGGRREPSALTQVDVPTELRPLIDAIEALRERDAEALRRQRRFIADAAHELRTPIAALSVQAENLERAVDGDERHARARRLGLGIARLQHLIAQLLDLARLQEGGETATLAVDPAIVIRRVVADLLPLADARGIDLGVSVLAHATLRDAGDGLARILTNALDNALRHTPPGGRVDVAVLDEGERTVLRVSDTGTGLPEAELERVFEPFRRGDDVRGAGTGLGLAICREIAARLGGSVTLSNRAGGGLVFDHVQPHLVAAASHCGVAPAPLPALPFSAS